MIILPGSPHQSVWMQQIVVWRFAGKEKSGVWDMVQFSFVLVLVNDVSLAKKVNRNLENTTHQILLVINERERDFANITGKLKSVVSFFGIRKSESI